MRMFRFHVEIPRLKDFDMIIPANTEEQAFEACKEHVKEQTRFVRRSKNGDKETHHYRNTITRLGLDAELTARFCGG